MSYYHDEFPSRRRIFPIVVLSIISAVVGGLLALSLFPLVYEKNLNLLQAPQQNEQQQAPLSSGYLDYSPVVNIAESVGPAIVGVSNQRMSRTMFGQELVEQGSGSGVIISSDGYIVTNYHVIENAQKIMVNLADGRQLEAEVKGSDPETDLAVLKIKANKLPTAVLGDSDKVKVGEMVVAIGNPLGYEFARSVTVGVVSAKDREITIQERKFNLIQTDAAINPGNSGGALVNSQGQVIGINSAKLVIQGVEGMGFAIPISDAKPIINELIEKGYISRPSLGIWGNTINEQRAQYYNIPVGIFISELIANGPADQAGIQPEDILIGINGTKVTSFDDLSAILKKFKPQDKVTVNIYRKGKKLDISLILGERGQD